MFLIATLLSENMLVYLNLVLKLDSIYSSEIDSVGSIFATTNTKL